MTTNVARDFGATCFFFVLSQLSKLTYNRTVGKLHPHSTTSPLTFSLYIIQEVFYVRSHQNVSQ